MSFYPYGEDRGTVQPNDSLKFATYTRDSATGLDYADQRYYASNFGRFMSPDPYAANNGAAGDSGDPGSWNPYDYTRGDPINRLDPNGLQDCGDPENPCPPQPIIFPGGNPGPGKKPGKGPPPPPPCNPGRNFGTQERINYITAHWQAALSEATTIQTTLQQISPNMSFSADSLAIMFLSWGAQESGYGQNPQDVAQNNDFGQQNPLNASGNWGGTTIPCVYGGLIPANTKNACFPAGMTWAQELTGILNTVSSKTGVQYLGVLEQYFLSNPGVDGDAGALQAIAANGYNPSSTYGTTAYSNTKIASLIQCLLGHGLITD
jgi:RHS repeat-associated protein